MAQFESLPNPTPDAVFALNDLAERNRGINLVVGAYRNAAGNPYVLKAVRAAEKKLLDQNLNKEYQAIEGDQHFRHAAVKLLLGQNFSDLGRTASAQSLGGTGACRIAAAVYSRRLDTQKTKVLFPNPTWANHRPIFADAGFKNIGSYRYYLPATKGVDIDGMLEDLNKTDDESIVVLHMCAHNPTGADPTPQQWELIADVVQKKKHFVLFDGAYQGYATGDLDADALAARIFLGRGLEFMAAQSFSKNMGLYGERVGCLSAVCKTSTSAVKLQGQMNALIRAMYSNPPSHGSRVATMILTDPELRRIWHEELLGMSRRITGMRSELVKALVQLKTPGDWSHITKQIGMFSYLGLNEKQCLALRKKNIYLLGTGRASIAGLTPKTLPDFAKGIHDVVTSPPSSL